MANQKFAIYDGAKIPINPTDTIADIKEIVSAYYPEVASYEVIWDNDGNATFKASGGSKGI